MVVFPPLCVTEPKVGEVASGQFCPSFGTGEPSASIESLGSEVVPKLKSTALLRVL